MTEWEKMLAGVTYDAFDNELREARKRAKLLCRKFNDLMPDEEEERGAVLHELLGKCGEHVWIEQPFLCDYGANIEVGENFYANYNLVVLDCAKVTIGKNAFIAPNVGLYTAAHPISAAQRIEGIEFAAPITIGDNVWIGGGVQVCPGVTIGDNTVIGAGSVVTHDIPSNVVAVGNPCRVLREITADDEIPAGEEEL